MMLQNNLFDPSQYGQGGIGGGPMSMGQTPMAGPSGFAGDLNPPGGGMFGAPPPMQQNKPNGFMHGLLPYLLMGGLSSMGAGLLGGSVAGGVAPLLAGAAYGLHKLKVF